MSDKEFKAVVVFLLLCIAFPVHYSWSFTIAFWLVVGFLYGVYRMVKGIARALASIVRRESESVKPLEFGDPPLYVGKPPAAKEPTLQELSTILRSI